MNTSTMLAILCIPLIISACSWVELKPEAENVRVATAGEVANCKKMGHSTVSVKADVATFARDNKKVQLELETLARNNAITLNGNVIVPNSDIDKGTQSFAIYNCP